jgi:hypothetical protein
MAQDSNEAISYLMALKQANSAAPAHPGDPVHASDIPEPEYHGINKRRSPRYKCEGSVQIREQGKDVHTWASFTDISFHGCYVEAQATYPVGTVLQLKLEANGTRVEALGNVRVNYPYLGMGIAFVEMSEENAAHLRQMLTAITRPSVIAGPAIASTLPATAPLTGLSEITNPQAALQALIDFFETRQMLVREDFVCLVSNSQK